jgi:hypothetical protein
VTEPAHSLPAKRSEPKSIQGEQQETAAPLYAEDTEVEKYVDTQSPGVVTCRERNRHDYPSIREAGLHFSGVDLTTGLHIRRVRCQSCNLVENVELWDIRHKGDTITRAERVSARPDYGLRGPNGERYLAPEGHGRMLPKQVRNAVATGQLKGLSFKEIRKAALRGGKS